MASDQAVSAVTATQVMGDGSPQRHRGRTDPQRATPWPERVRISLYAFGLRGSLWFSVFSVPLWLTITSIDRRSASVRRPGTPGKTRGPPILSDRRASSTIRHG